MTAYDPSQWGDLFVATAGASAALTGLVFVAVSINIKRILKLAGLPERGVETLVLLLTVLLVSPTGLIPGQGRTALGVELLAVSVIAGTGLIRLPWSRSGAPSQSLRLWLVVRWSTGLTAVILFTIGAVSILFAGGGGLYWIVAWIVFAILGASLNACAAGRDPALKERLVPTRARRRHSERRE